MDTILSETVRVSKLSLQELRAELPAGWIIPPMIPIGSHTIYTSVQAVDAINKLSELYRKECAKYTVSTESFASYTRHAIGEMIVEIRNNPPNEDNLLARAVGIFGDFLRRRLSNAATDLTEIVPCDVFDEDQKAPTFSIGPVNFAPRLEWLKIQSIPIQTSLIEQVWAGQLQLDNLQKMGQSGNITQIDLFSASELIRHIGGHSWVATVPFDGHDIRQAHVKGPLFVELALDFLSLFFGADSGRRLLHPGIQGRLSETVISLDKNGRTFSGWKFNKPGVGGPPNMAKELLSNRKDLLDAAGVILRRYSSDSDAGNISRLIDRWINALHWYGTAMRHYLDFMALADYGDALDILSGAGGNTGWMINYCATALNVSKQKQITEDDSSLEGVINEIYNLGRSAIRHGNQFGLMTKFGSERARAHELLRVLLLIVTEPLADIVRRDDRMLTLDNNEIRAFLCVLSERHSKTDP